jgi:hypothetical protein
MMRSVIRYGALAGVVCFAAACDLQVDNPNDPGTDQVLASPLESETLVGSYYRRWHGGMYTGLGNYWGVANVQSFENYSSLANNGQNARAGIPRPANDNTISNVTQGENQQIYFRNSEVNRIASNILTRFTDATYSTGDIGRDNRVRAFAEFLRGLSMGYIAMFYDSAAVSYPGQSTEEAGDLLHYSVVAESAYVALQRALDYAALPNVPSIPPAWMPVAGGVTNLTPAEFSKIIHSYRARIRANMARTPAERAAVNWATVIADAAAGITVDHEMTTNTTTGPEKDWVAQYMSFGQWHQMTPWIIGMGDNSSAYASWIALPLPDRGTTGEFTMVSPDLRFPQGADRTAQQADFAITSCSDASTPCKRYFRNRPAGDDQTAGLGWGLSNYDWVRHYSWFIKGDGTGQNGKMVFFTKAENDLLRAEGLLRTGDLAGAAALINLTRTAGMVGGVATGGGLPAVTGTADGGLTGATCIPKRPVSAGNGGGGTLTCGDLMEALKWEKRIETAYTHFAGWFLDHRGWGDLAEGTPLQLATPYQDLMARSKPLYSMGLNTTGGSAAAVSTYGW